VIFTPVVSQGASFFPPVANTQIVAFGNGVSLVRDGSSDGLQMLTTASTTSKLVYTVTVHDAGVISTITNTIPSLTVSGSTFPVAAPSGLIDLVRIVAGDPANRGNHTVIELHRDRADFEKQSYIGTMASQLAQ
jgi:hypothetical protein